MMLEKYWNCVSEQAKEFRIWSLLSVSGEKLDCSKP